MENTKRISDRLTIIIPSKNEGLTLYLCLMHISRQRGIDGTKVYVADSSTEYKSKYWLSKAQEDFKELIYVEEVEGGYPAKARFEGSKKCETEYMLFIDADMMLLRSDIIEIVLKKIEDGKDLTTVTMETDRPYRYIYKSFYWVQLFYKNLIKTSFAIGGFQMWRTKEYWRLGGYVESELFAEDYSLSKKVHHKKFSIEKVKGVYTSSRRFENKGALWMIIMMFKCYLNRKNPEFFKKSHGYWD